MNWFDRLIEQALDDEYLDELLVKAEKMYSEKLMKLPSGVLGSVLTEKEFCDLLRFSDLLCRAATPSGRNRAYKIISLLYDQYHGNSFFQSCAETVLTKLGIFPTLALIEKESSVCSNPEIRLERIVKETFQSSPINNKVFTNAQYALFEKLKNSNHYSFSGPTSFGKSFIMEAFIHHIISERNASDNIVILVPTRALINQVSAKLKSEITHPSYKILTHPIIPAMYQKSQFKYIFVFTPERWISYVSNTSNPVITYMFIDEAHKVVSNKDSRSPLYYHAILMAQRKSVNLYFASPNIPNAEVFLELFEKSQAESMVIQDSPVSQNRYYFDLVNKYAIQFSDTGKDITIPMQLFPANIMPSALIARLGNGCQNIVYCNTIEDTISYALKFSQKLPEKKNAKIDELISLIKSFVHKDYYLIDCLKHGVAFHFGRLPQRIREKVETLFSDGDLDYVFCTSTLLEGVNLPAKNIFILSNAIGLTKFSDIDFWNLAGRAGRLSKELSGNIICLRILNKRNRWDRPEQDLKIVRNRNIANVTPTVIKGEKNFYQNLGNAIQNAPFTKSKPTQPEIDFWNHYSNILFIHQIEKNDSILISNFLKKNPNAKQILSTVSKANNVPLFILEQSSMIKPAYQNKLWNNDKLCPFPTEVSLETCREILDLLYDNYCWADEESGGRNPMVRDRTRLQYFSHLMFSWIQGDPLNLIINRLLKYYQKKGEIFYQGNYIDFDHRNRSHINYVINELMSDIDNALRFKIKNYILNYSLITKEKISDEVSLRWVDYLEYGTTDTLVISLQTLGIPRHLASFVINNHLDCLTIENSAIVDIDLEKLQASIDATQNSTEYAELATIFNWQLHSLE